MCVHGSPVHYEIVDKGRWRDDLIRCDHADRNDVFGRDNHRVGRHRHHRIKVTSGEHIGQVAEVIGNKRMDKREIRAHRGLEQEGLPIELDMLLALLDDCPDSGWGQHASETAAASADALDQRALRHQVDRDLLCHHLLLRLRI